MMGEGVLKSLRKKKDFEKRYWLPENLLIQLSKTLQVFCLSAHTGDEYMPLA